MNVISEVPQVVIGGGWHEVPVPREFRLPADMEDMLFRGGSSHYTFDGLPKIGYVTKEEAVLAGHRTVVGTEKRMRAYRCRECPQWHIGNSEKGNIRATERVLVAA